VGVTIARGVIGGIGVALVLASIAVMAVAGPGGDLFGALFLFLPGVLMIIAVILERNRYRSLHAERIGDPSGPGGGETAPPGPRFRPTDERFVDPTTTVPMRVWIDPQTGERVYVPEG
jgi:hypothetical protein